MCKTIFSKFSVEKGSRSSKNLLEKKIQVISEPSIGLYFVSMPESNEQRRYFTGLLLIEGLFLIFFLEKNLQNGFYG